MVMDLDELKWSGFAVLFICSSKPPYNRQPILTLRIIIIIKCDRL